MENIIENLKDGYNEIDLRISKNDVKEDSIEIKICGEEFFISLFIYKDEKICGSITTNRSVNRFMSKDILKSSDGFKSLESGDYKISYLLYKKK